MKHNLALAKGTLAVGKKNGAHALMGCIMLILLLPQLQSGDVMAT